MQTWGYINKFSISFSSKIFDKQLNDVLCFFSKASNSKITQVVSLEGKSCSLDTAPTNYYFKYNGTTQTK